MQPTRWVFIGVLSVMCAHFVGTAVGATPELTSDPELTQSDCVKCHEREPAEVLANGAAHGTELSCQDCHDGHPPRVADIIPQCGDCHSGEEHYEIKECTSCHNPHAPLEVRLEGELKAVCLTCHRPPGQEMQASPSAHAEFACNECHAEKHGVIPTCLDCHDSHSETMTQGSCRACHQAHKPTDLEYGSDVPNVQCGACHVDALAQLTASVSKHGPLACVLCHADRHRTLAVCTDCHGEPHAPGMHARFPHCGDCHNTAHNLNNWSDSEGPGTTKEPAKDR